MSHRLPAYASELPSGTEELYQSLVEAMEEGVVVQDAGGQPRMTKCDATVCRVTPTAKSDP